MKKIIIALSLSTTALIVRCPKDFLNTTPTSTLSSKQIEGTEKGVEFLVNGLHNMLYSYSHGSMLQRGQNSMGLVLDFLSDDVINTQDGGWTALYQWTDPRDPNGSLNSRAWDYYFTIIQHANTAIASAERLNLSQTAHGKRLVANALAIRAFAYHQLVQLFGKYYQAGTDNAQLGVPLRLVANYDLVPRATVGEIYKQILSDIDKAMELLRDLPDSEQKMISATPQPVV